MKALRPVRLLVLMWTLLLVGCAVHGSNEMPDLQANAKIDLARYMGAWQVIANIPYFAEKGKVASRDVYSLDAKGNIATSYFYRTAFDTPEKSVDSLGVVQPNSGNARWIVRFFWLFRADYLILEVAPDYSWALVGQPGRKLGWVFSRATDMDEAVYTGLLEKFRGYGYDSSRFKRIARKAADVGKPGYQ